MSRNVGLLRKAVYVVAARRTPCGAFGGSFKDLTATDLAVAAANHTIKDAGISAEKIDSVVIGNVSRRREQRAAESREQRERGRARGEERGREGKETRERETGATTKETFVSLSSLLSPFLFRGRAT